MYLLPELRKQSKIIIYGNTVEGIMFLEQSRLLGLEVVGFYDMNENDWNYPVVDNSILLDGTKYDYIVIAEKLTYDRTEIVDRLITDYNIDEQKIINSRYEIIIPNCGIAAIEKEEELIGVLRNISIGRNSIENEIEYISANISKSALECIRYEMFHLGNVKYKILCATILMKRDEYLENENIYLMNQLLMDESEEYVSYKHKFLFDILPVYMFRHPYIEYNSYWKDARNLMIQIGKICYNNNYVSVPRKRNTIVLLTPSLLGETYHFSNIVFNAANLLAENSYDVHVVIEDNIYNPEEYFIKNRYGSGKKSYLFHSEHVKMIDPRVTIHYPGGGTLIERMNGVVREIYNISPEIIVIYGTDNNANSYALYGNFPIMYSAFFMKITSSLYDLKLYQDDAVRQALYKKMCYSESENYAIIMPEAAYKEPQNVYDGREYGIDDKFVVVTVGNRLKYELDSEIIEAMANFLKSKENAVWLIVGCESLSIIDSDYSEYIENGKIVFLKYEKDLPALYRICDVYLNPDRVGGGTTIVWAMQQSLPIAQKKRVSDGASWTGVQNTIDGDIRAVVAYIERLYEDADYHNTERLKFRKIVEQYTKEAQMISFDIASRRVKHIYKKK